MKVSFTLIEIIVAIAIIAILAAITAPNAFRAIEKAKVTATIGDIKAVKYAAQSYFADTGVWPNSCFLTPCSVGFINDDGNPGWDGPYIDKWPQTRWDPMLLGIIDIQYYAYWNFWGTFMCSPVGEERLILINGIPKSSALKIDEMIDGTIDANAGSIRSFNFSFMGNQVNLLYALITCDGQPN